MIINKINIVIGLLKFYLNKYNYLFIWLWGVNIGSKTNFYGKVYFNRQKSSVINIGNNCTFRSSKTSNWIGVNRPCMISTQTSNATIKIGNNCGFSGTVIGAFKGIYLGENVRCGANTLITDSDWHLDDMRVGEPIEVYIEDNVWLGINSIVLKGVRIGVNSVIGANSVVVKDIPANVIAAGNPCRVIKNIQGAN